jgi:thermostable 8-oxoguanine DNA glycosylase
MVNPEVEITKYDRPKTELQEWLIFSILVANKPAKRTALVTDQLLKSLPGGTPFNRLRMAIIQKRLRGALMRARTGQYKRIYRALKNVVGDAVFGPMDPATVSLDRLEEAVGPKTARFFLLSTRAGVRAAALDTHVLKFLRSQGYEVPKATPSKGKKYREIEQWFLQEADKRGMTPANLDAEVWASYAVKKAAYVG